MSTDSPSCISDSLLATEIAAYLQNVEVKIDLWSKECLTLLAAVLIANVYHSFYMYRLAVTAQPSVFSGEKKNKKEKKLLVIQPNHQREA